MPACREFAGIQHQVMKTFTAAFFLFFCFRATGSGQGNAGIAAQHLMEVSEVQLREFLQQARPSPLMQLFWKRKHKDQKVKAALLAFPFPCGMVGLHRIYLGTAPYVPVVYIATIGGVFGILPFIDFCVLLLDKEIEPYIMNKKVFMWAH
jgi:TM2 domain-containing membrane protein YozV